MNNEPITAKGRLVQAAAKLAIAGPWRSSAESLTCAIGRKFPSSRVVLSLCRHVGTQLVKREGAEFERVVTLASGGKMLCSDLNGVSTTGLMYYFLGTINGQTEDERPIEKLLSRAVKAGDTFFDIGANYGFYSFLLGNVCGKNGSVHSFEANPLLIPHLTRSAALNRNSANIVINHVAIGSSNLDEVILYDPERIGCSSLHKHEWVDTKKSVAIPQITVDHYVKTNSIKKIDCIKIDIEGAELDAFRGMEHTFNTMPPSLIVCELMPFVNLTTDGKSEASDLKRASSAASPVGIWDLLTAKGYQAYFLRESGALGDIVSREFLQKLSESIINVAFVHGDFQQKRRDLFDV